MLRWGIIRKDHFRHIFCNTDVVSLADRDTITAVFAVGFFVFLFHLDFSSLSEKNEDRFNYLSVDSSLTGASPEAHFLIS